MLLDHTGLISDFGFEDHILIPRAGITTVDFFILNPGQVMETYDKEKRPVKRISFKCTSRPTSVPVFE
jgi:hypothetical protein